MKTGSECERGPLGHRRYRMDYVADPDLFQAVKFARKMIGTGMHPGRAYAVAAKYYSVSRDDVAHYAAQYAGSMGGKAKSRSPKASRHSCHRCKHLEGSKAAGWFCPAIDAEPYEGGMTRGCDKYEAKA